MLGNIVLVVIGMILIISIGFIFLISVAHKKVKQGTALVRTGFGGAQVALDSGIFVLPILHKVEEIDISLKQINLKKVEKEGVLCSDNIRADVKMAFFVRINKDPRRVIEVAQTIGCERGGSETTMRELFVPKFEEAIKTVFKQYNFEDLFHERDSLKANILRNIGSELNGYILDDLAIDYIEQTDIKYLDPNNILDAQGIKKITQIAAIEKEAKLEIERATKLAIKEQNMLANEALLNLDRQEEENKRRIEKELKDLNDFKNR